MSKRSIARRGNKFVAAHNARVERATKGLRRVLVSKRSKKWEAVLMHGIHSTEARNAREEEKRADRVLRAAQDRLGYITINDRVLIAVFGK